MPGGYLEQNMKIQFIEQIYVTQHDWIWLQNIIIIHLNTFFFDFPLGRGRGGGGGGEGGGEGVSNCMEAT